MLLLFRPPAEQDWAVMMENTRPLEWAFALPILFVFVLSLLSARNVLKDERLKRGVGYVISETGIHVDTSVSNADFSWAAIHRAKELPFGFLVFTSPRIAFALPKRCFETSQDMAAVRDLFRAHVQKTTLRRN